MKRPLPSILPLVIVVGAFAIGYFFPLTADFRVSYVFGWAIGILSVITAGR